jgi:methyltransferase-like protein
MAEVDRVAGGNRILRDQYYDFLKCRMFRQTLLCHQNIALPDAPVAERVRLLYACSAAKPVSERPDLRPGVAEEFRGGHGSGVTAAHPFAKAVMQLLCQAWPETLSFPGLLASATQLTAEDATPAGLVDILLATYAAGVIELHAAPAQCVAKVSRFPVASQLARSQARRGRLIATMRHTVIDAQDEKVRLLINLLDGEHDFDALVRELAPALKLPEADLAKGIQAHLELLANAGALVG